MIYDKTLNNVFKDITMMPFAEVLKFTLFYMLFTINRLLWLLMKNCVGFVWMSLAVAAWYISVTEIAMYLQNTVSHSD